MEQPYKTLKQKAWDEQVVLKSRFIGHAAPVSAEEQALAFLQAIRGQYKDASHVCFAYIVGKNAGIMRYSDDGEPGGTAGMPILKVMQAQGLVDCAVAVVRYFGGVLLGAGGLTRAYAHACARALEASQPVVMEPSVRILCEVAYPLWDAVAYALKDWPVVMEGTDFTDRVTITLLVRARDEAALYALLARVTDGRAQTLEEERVYAGWAPDGGA